MQCPLESDHQGHPQGHLKATGAQCPAGLAKLLMLAPLAGGTQYAPHLQGSAVLVTAQMAEREWQMTLGLLVQEIELRLEFQQDSLRTDRSNYLSYMAAGLPGDMGNTKDTDLNGSAFNRQLELCDIFAQLLWCDCFRRGGVLRVRLAQSG
ncbi:MAG: hypothetical protein FRX49_13356 [Trebouxia sp. A1-2]|nr:MAG: hypothetical protein FRX49_13356 [Trebouxia sp. A1-2]